MVILSSMVFPQSGIRVVGGITYSSISGDKFIESLIEDTGIDVNSASIVGLRIALLVFVKKKHKI